MGNSYLVNEVQLSYKYHKPTFEMPVITGPESAYKLLMEIWSEDRIEFIEEAKLLLLNRAKHVIGCYHLSSGGTISTIADPKLIFTAALKTNAASIILAHNHPTGLLVPSDQDKKLTKQLTDAGNTLGITLDDHFIITNHGYYSFADQMAHKIVKRSTGTYFECQPPF